MHHLLNIICGCGCNSTITCGCIHIFLLTTRTKASKISTCGHFSYTFLLTTLTKASKMSRNSDGEAFLPLRNMVCGHQHSEPFSCRFLAYFSKSACVGSLARRDNSITWGGASWNVPSRKCSIYSSGCLSAIETTSDASSFV